MAGCSGAAASAASALTGLSGKQCLLMAILKEAACSSGWALTEMSNLSGATELWHVSCSRVLSIQGKPCCLLELCMSLVGPMNWSLYILSAHSIAATDTDLPSNIAFDTPTITAHGSLATPVIIVTLGTRAPLMTSSGCMDLERLILLAHGYCVQILPSVTNASHLLATPFPSPKLRMTLNCLGDNLLWFPSSCLSTV